MGTRLYYHRLTPRRFLRVLHDYDAFFRLHIETIEEMVPHRVTVLANDDLFYLFDPVRRHPDWKTLSREESRPTTEVGKIIRGGHLMHEEFRDRHDHMPWYFTPEEVETGAEALFRMGPEFNDAFEAHWNTRDDATRRNERERLRGHLDRLRKLYLSAASEGDMMIRYWW